MFNVLQSLIPDLQTYDEDPDSPVVVPLLPKVLLLDCQSLNHAQLRQTALWIQNPKNTGLTSTVECRHQGSVRPSLDVVLKIDRMNGTVTELCEELKKLCDVKLPEPEPGCSAGSKCSVISTGDLRTVSQALCDIVDRGLSEVHFVTDMTLSIVKYYKVCVARVGKLFVWSDVRLDRLMVPGFKWWNKKTMKIGKIAEMR